RERRKTSYGRWATSGRAATPPRLTLPSDPPPHDHDAKGAIAT
ncbi:hypothetical protein KFL_002240110, partial [Klebsormidium nitens]